TYQVIVWFKAAIGIALRNPIAMNVRDDIRCPVPGNIREADLHWWSICQFQEVEDDSCQLCTRNRLIWFECTIFVSRKQSTLGRCLDAIGIPFSLFDI